MPAKAVNEPFILSLVTENELVESTVRLSFPAPHEVRVFSMEGLVGAAHTLAEHGHEVVKAASDSHVLFLDWDFTRAPELNTLCYHVRKSVHTPILALCKGAFEDQVAAVAAGADDALTFPIYPSVLQAKLVSYHRLVKAARDLERELFTPESGAVVERDPHRRGVRFGELFLDRGSHRFYINDVEVEVTPREIALLDYLNEHAESVCTRDAILDHVWGIDFDTGTNMVDVYMYFLRRKLEAHGLKGMIQTVRGYGYRMSKAGAVNG